MDPPGSTSFYKSTMALQELAFVAVVVVSCVVLLSQYPMYLCGALMAAYLLAFYRCRVCRVCGGSQREGKEAAAAPAAHAAAEPAVAHQQQPVAWCGAQPAPPAPADAGDSRHAARPDIFYNWPNAQTGGGDPRWAVERAAVWLSDALGQFVPPRQAQHQRQSPQPLQQQQQPGAAGQFRAQAPVFASSY